MGRSSSAGWRAVRLAPNAIVTFGVQPSDLQSLSLEDTCFESLTGSCVAMKAFSANVWSRLAIAGRCQSEKQMFGKGPVAGCQLLLACPMWSSGPYVA